MSFARDILEIGLKGPNARAVAFADAVLRHNKSDIVPGSKREHDLRLGFFFNLSNLARDVQRAMCFSIDHSMQEALRKMDKTPEETLLKALKYARPPHDPAWIEYLAPNGNRIGWLIKNNPGGGLVVQAASRKADFPTPLTGRTIIITEDGLSYQGISGLTKEISKDEKIPPTDEDNHYLMRSSVSLLLLLNSRSNIVTVSEPLENYDKLNKKRARNGEFELPTLKQIKFDVARIVAKNPDISASDAEKEMAATLVRGHFKVRKTGAFFWSPYVRGARDEAEKVEVYKEKLGATRVVTNSGPHCLPK